MTNLVKIQEVLFKATMPITIKQDFVLNLIIGFKEQLRDKWSFIENVSTPFKLFPDCDELDQLLNGILGYYIYLFEDDINDEKIANFVSYSIQDIQGYMKFFQGEYKFKTLNYKSYLKKR